MEQASFTVSSWQEQPIDNLNENFPVNQASATYQLSGALSGTAYVEYLMTYQGSSMADGLEAVAQVVGFLHFEGTYLGKKGTFTACEKGTFTQGLLDCPGELFQASGELAGLSGRYTYEFSQEEALLHLDFV
ncbi:DUF3224 domain-containing protein [Enterococcus faecalis]|uniref:DUF3224 domain-containing protein n=1 Tax=Enterococcus TaxID=1350 RepID=UPI0001B1E09C|nr:DUF3224 domain-containing protein [Enterococcus faecalis]AQL53922.1 PbsX family transcriptional regulator [Enterococcus faecalis]AXG88745.1 DUF3224 family protein [Enterococcus faecalis]AYZ07722.1 DUF3224 family protein [Enterococcus faecalis]EET99011.1 conserved hypothetical protein [Enterococcus faecalis T2]EFM73318.1 hypothetical protein HMPREF9515_01597 [Enterococcus faecalis TX0860]